MIYTEILLRNACDPTIEKFILHTNEHKRQANVNMIVDADFSMTCIPRAISDKLELRFMQKRRFQLPDGQIDNFDVVGPLRIHFLDRNSCTIAIVVPDEVEPILGWISIEEMGLLIDRTSRKLIPSPKSLKGPWLRI
ncbi:MAG: hypothetical protein DI535_12635 [Citrobacter freundii]|nr:MAG: hypothetical protein DI535_12635 [Citrobacter freundii]